MRISIVGFNLPGAVFCRPDGSPLHDVRVGIQIGREPAELRKASLHEVAWDVEVEVIERGDEIDFRGSPVQGKRGDRFVYLTWGNVGPDDDFEMFRRAKLMLNRIDQTVLRSALAKGHVYARVDMTSPSGGPVAARVDPPAIEWSATPLGYC